MILRRSVAFMAAAILWAGGVSAQTVAAPSPAPVVPGRGVLKIGVVNPFSGPMALYGDEMTRGFDLAVDRANAAGGVLGRTVQIVRASATTPQEAISAVEQLVSRDKVDLLCPGPMSPPCPTRRARLRWVTTSYFGKPTLSPRT